MYIAETLTKTKQREKDMRITGRNIIRIKNNIEPS